MRIQPATGEALKIAGFPDVFDYTLETGDNMRRYYLSAAVTFSLFTAMTGSAVQAQDSIDPSYLEKRNDLGIIAFCSDKGLLDKDSEEFFQVGIDEIYGEVPDSDEADLHEQKGRDGISYLQGDEQPLEELAEANNVDVAAVCKQYKSQVTLGRMIAKQKSGQ